MINSSKGRKLISVILSVIAALSLLCVSVGAAMGATGTLGSETPYLEASYVDENGDVANGQELAPGTYTMTFTLYGMQTLSEFQVTAYYDISVITFGDYSNLLADSYDFLATSSPVIRDTELVFGFMSNDFDSCSAINPDGTDLFSIKLTVSADSSVNMRDENVISLSSSPHYTYFEADFGDIRMLEGDPVILVYDCYALGEDPSFLGTVYPMSADLAPDIHDTSSYSVTAYIGGLASPQDDYGTYAVQGAVVKISENEDIFAVTDSEGKFTLNGLESGTYEAIVTYEYGFERSFTIVVDDADVVSDTMVGIVHCNFNPDGYINVSDYNVYAIYNGKTPSSEDYQAFANLNNDGYINVSDYNIYAKFVGKTLGNMVYADTVISN